MKLKRVIRDNRGVTAVEFGLTAPLFFALIFGMAEIGLALWYQLGIEHGAQMAARCATVSKTTCANADAIKNYAVSQSYGLNIPASTFSYNPLAACNQVSATYVFNFITLFMGTPHVTLTAQSCFPR